MRVRVWMAAAFLSIFAVTDLQAQRPRELRGSRTKLSRQNGIARKANLSEMKDAAMIDRMTKNGYLVVVSPRGKGWYLDPDMGRDPHCAYMYPEKLRRIRPHVLKVMNSEGRIFADAFPGSSFKVSGLIRTEGYQRQLRRCNPNAAKRSPHLTGSAFDISKSGLTTREIAFLRRRMILLQKRGQVSAIEEVVTNSFHVFVIPPRPSSHSQKNQKKR